MIDDFGTGYSSLAQLHRMDVDTLKVDQAFTQALSKGSEGELMYRAIISMATTLKMCVVAEGVETLEQLRLLQAIGCDEVQGYIISRALPAAEIMQLTSKNILPPFDRVGQLVVGGIGFVGQCDGEPKSGILALYDYYMKSRAVKRKGKAFPITLDDVTGTVTLKGFLTGVQLSVNNDGAMGVMGHWSLRFDVLPEEPAGGGEWQPPLSTPQLRGWANT